MRALPTMGLALAALAVGAGVAASSCSQTPTNVPIRTFEGAQKVAVVCMQVLNVPDPAHGPVPVAQDNCAPVAAGVVTTTLPFHLYAAVTQTTRGELAVVDLTTGFVVDEDQSTPGTNFIPVGTNPTDVAIPPDGTFTYVSSASATKPAIYAINNRSLLGDNSAAGNPQVPPLQLTNLAACSLPQPPMALAIANIPDGSGADGGGIQSQYALIALLGPEGNQPAQVVSIDPTNFIQQTQMPGALPPCVIAGRVRLSEDVPGTWLPGPPWPDGVPYVDGGVDLVGQEPSLGPPGTCSPPVTVDGAPEPEVASEAGVPEASPGPVAPVMDAMAEGGLDATAPDGGVEDAAVEDAAIEEAGPEPVLPEAAAPIMAAAEAGALDAGFALARSPLSTPNPSSMVMRDDLHLLYVADLSLPLIHVIDLTNPSAPVEIEPLLATSVAQPARPVNVGGLALSPPTRDYKRYLYAIDQSPGSLMVYDVTNGAASPHVPLIRPHAELDPFAPADRITFSSPVATMAFATHDWPAQVPSGSNVTPNVSLAYQGLLCNPNPNAHPNATTFNDIGAYYRVDQAGTIQANATAENFPSRLRGVFAFATLSNGTVVAIDVDDWDAPCRRPDPMVDGGITGSLDVPEPDASTSLDGGLDLDPYHVPTAYFAGTDNSLAESPPVTLEPFFPVSAPHRIRSGVLVRNDPTSGIHVPNLVGVPELADLNGTGVVTSGQMGTAQPLLLPTVLEPGFIDPTLLQNPTEPNPASPPRTYFPEAGTFPDPVTAPTPGVRLSFEDPTVVQNQDWQVTYEGVLPSSTGIFANIASSPPGDFTTLTFTTAGANLCGLGVEDWSIGQLRAQQALRDMKAEGLPVSSQEATLPRWTSDYVEITDDILASTDPYWGNNPQACWDIPGTDLGDGGTSGMSAAAQRYNLCQATFGSPGTNPDQDVTRDAPIIAAYTDHLVVGRFGFSGQLETTGNRTVDPGSPNNPTFLKLMACCFHNQAAFKVRAGGEWIAVGQQSLGLLHHVQASQDPADPNRCVLSCDPKDSLLNSRSFDVPWSTAPACAEPKTFPQIGRNDGLAMRNPMFSYVTWGGCGSPTMGGTSAHTLTARDLAWKFTVAGGFSPLTISLSGATAVAVSPQSMLFIPSLGQMAIVDGEQQGLVIVDLNSVTILNNFF